MQTRYGSERVSGATLRAAREKKEGKYAVAEEEDARRVFTLGIEMGGRMDPQFHEVLYRLARADAMCPFVFYQTRTPKYAQTLAPSYLDFVVIKIDDAHHETYHKRIPGSGTLVISEH